MVIFGAARSCGLPAAQGLRPQAPAVLPWLCQQGAGGGGGRRPSGRARPAGAAGRWASAKRVASHSQRKPEPTWPRRRKVADPGAPASIPSRVAKADRPRLGLWHGVRPGSREPGPASGPGRRPKEDKMFCLLYRKAQVPASRARSSRSEASEPRASRLPSKPRLLARLLHAACPEPPRAPLPERPSLPEAMRAPASGGPQVHTR